MTTETTVENNGPGQDPREAGQERRLGTIDLDGTGAGTHTVSLTGNLHALGMGLFGTVSVADGSATLTNLTVDSVDIEVTGGTADATDVAWELVVAEDKFYRESGGV